METKIKNYCPILQINTKLNMADSLLEEVSIIKILGIMINNQLTYIKENLDRGPHGSVQTSLWG